MKCEKCGQNIATTHIRSVVNGVAVEKNLCSHCASQEGYSLSPQNGLADMLASMFGQELRKNRINTKKCPVCNSDFSAIAKSGKAGCSMCYQTFKSELLPYLKRVHGSTKHIGRTPNSSAFKNDNTVESLRKELSQLVAEERYEQAAVVRDKIKEIEGGTNG